MARAGAFRAVDQSENAIVVDAAQAVVLAVRHGGGGAKHRLHSRTGRGQSLRFGEIGIDDLNARGKQRSRFFMTVSAAYECAHGAALMTKTECDLLTDKTRGANDEIHRQPPWALRAVSIP